MSEGVRVFVGLCVRVRVVASCIQFRQQRATSTPPPPTPPPPPARGITSFMAAKYAFADSMMVLERGVRLADRNSCGCGWSGVGCQGMVVGLSVTPIIRALNLQSPPPFAPYMNAPQHPPDTPCVLRTSLPV